MEASDPMDKSMMYSWSSYVYIITSYLSNLLSILPRTKFLKKWGLLPLIPHRILLKSNLGKTRSLHSGTLRWIVYL